MTYIPYGLVAPTEEDANMDSALTQLLCHCDGTDGQQSVTDNSIYGLSGTVSGNAAVSTATKVFGTGSMYFDGNSSSKVVFDNSSGVINPGANDFTIECRVLIKSSKTKMNVLLAQTESTAQQKGWSLVTTPGSEATFAVQFKYYSSDGLWYTFYNQVGYTMTLDAWHHVAICRDNNFLTMSYDGVMQPDMRGVANGSTIGGANPYLRFGHNLYTDETNGNGTMYGNLDEVCLTFGKCLYPAGQLQGQTGVKSRPVAANFTPPASAYSNPAAITPGANGAIRSNGKDSIYYKNGTGAWVRIEDTNTRQQRYIRP
jgi:hypothetical protein